MQNSPEKVRWHLLYSSRQAATHTKAEEKYLMVQKRKGRRRKR
jgi:hypothetical protein